jgi:hypothetical protein
MTPGATTIAAKDARQCPPSNGCRRPPTKAPQASRQDEHEAVRPRARWLIDGRRARFLDAGERMERAFRAHVK